MFKKTIEKMLKEQSVKNTIDPIVNEVIHSDMTNKLTKFFNKEEEDTNTKNKKTKHSFKLNHF